MTNTYNCLSYTPAISHIPVSRTDSWDGLFSAVMSRTNAYEPLMNDPSPLSAVTYIPPGTQLTAEAVSVEVSAFEDKNVWIKTTYNSKTGWCSAYYLTYTIYARVTNPEGAILWTFNDSTATQTDKCFVYDSEVSVVRLSLDDDEALIMAPDRDDNGDDTGTDIIWLKTKYDDIEGYIKLYDVNIVSNHTYMDLAIASQYIYTKKTERWDGLFQATTNASILLRADAGTNYAQVNLIQANTDITVKDFKSSSDGSIWCKTTYNNTDGWCSSLNLRYKVYARVINPDGVQLYDISSGSNDVSLLDGYIVPYGTEVSFIKETDNDTEALVWKKKYNTSTYTTYGRTKYSGDNIYGYIMLSDVEILSERMFNTWIPCTPYITVFENLFNACTQQETSIYSEPSTNSELLFNIASNENLPVIEIYSKDAGEYMWFKVKYRGYTGWVISDRTTYSANVIVSSPEGAAYYTGNEVLIDAAPMPYGKEISISDSWNSIKNPGKGLLIRIDDYYVLDSEGNEWIAYISISDIKIV